MRKLILCLRLAAAVLLLLVLIPLFILAVIANAIYQSFRRLGPKEEAQP